MISNLGIIKVTIKFEFSRFPGHERFCDFLNPSTHQSYRVQSCDSQVGHIFCRKILYHTHVGYSKRFWTAGLHWSYTTCASSTRLCFLNILHHHCLHPLCIALLAPTVRCIACSHCALHCLLPLCVAFFVLHFHLYLSLREGNLKSECHFDYARAYSKSWILTMGW